MAYDESLADRIRQLIGPEPDISEKKMFGGLAFLVNGNMSIAASSDGGILVRTDPAESEKLLATTDAQLMEMRGRAMPGWLRVDTENISGDDELLRWVEAGVNYARSLPVKTS